MTKIAIQNISRSSKLNLDMNFLGTHLLRDEKAVAAVIRKLSPPRSFVSFLSRYGIMTDEAGAGTAGVSSGTVSESLIRWRITDTDSQALRIIDISQVPETLKVDVQFRITLNDGWVDPDALLLSSDGTTVFKVIRRDPSLNADSVGCDYILSLHGNDSAQEVSSTMLSTKKYLNYFSNAKGERSSTSQELQIKQSSMDMFNVTQVMRHKIGASGHGLSTAMDQDRLAYLEMSQVGGRNVLKKAYGLPFGAKLIQDHLKKIDQTLFFGRTNFNPYTRGLSNGDAPTLAGIKQQFEYTDQVYDFSPTDNPEYNMLLVESIIEQARMKYEMEEGCDFVIVTGNGGERVLQDIMTARFKRDGVVRQQSFTPGQTTATVGHKFGNKYVSQYGEFTIANYGFSANERGARFDQVTYGGATYDAFSFNMYLVPILPSTYYGGSRKNIRLVTKAHNGINRGLVVGSMPGMSGLYNGRDIGLEKITGADMQFIQNIENTTKIASPVDGEELMCLSEFSVIVENPDDIIWLRPKF
jgi:hypothetical protein